MTQTTNENRSLGDALTDLSSSADGLGTNVRELKRAIDDLETSTEQLSNSQAAASESLNRAAENLAPSARGQPTPGATGDSSGFSAVADD